MPISKNLIDIRKEILKSSNSPARLQLNPEHKEVTLVAVSKFNPVNSILDAYGAGQRIFGENKVQELTEKIEALSDKPDIHWHMLGHLQRNKVKYICGKVDLIHSVDSVRLAKQIEEESAKISCVTNILLEVNMAHEESKYGFLQDEVYDAIEEIKEFPHVHVCGLMTIAPNVEHSEDNRKVFRNMYQLFIDIRGKKLDNIDMNILSMGMTGDYQVAIEEGSTMVRVGTGIFGARNYAV